MPKYTIFNATASTVVLPVSPAVTLRAGKQVSITVLASVMDDPNVASMIKAGLIRVTAENDPDTPDVLEVSPSTLIGGREVDVKSLPPEGEKVYASSAPVTGIVPRVADAFGGFMYEVFIETTANGGDDTNGDGSAVNPFATLKTALDALPSVAVSGSDYGMIRIGPGDFDHEGAYKGFLPVIYIHGNYATEETLTVSTVTPVAGSATEYDIQFTTDVTTPVASAGDAMLEASWAGAYRGWLAYSDVVLSKPASDTIRVNANWWGAAADSELILSTKDTRFRPGDGTVGIYASGITELTISAVNIDWTGYAGSNTFSIKNTSFNSCNIISPKTTLYDGAMSRSNSGMANCYVNCTNDFQIQRAIGFSASWYGNVFDATRLLIFVSDGYPISRSLIINNTQVDVIQFQRNFASVHVSLSVLAIRDCANPVTVSGPSSTITFNGDISIQGTCSRLVTVGDGARIARNSGAGTGVCTGIPVQITDGIATGITSWAFTNSGTSGEEVKVGGLAAQTFASLPNADFTGAAATGSKAT